MAKAHQWPIRTPLSPQRIEVFLSALREHGVVSWAALAASPHVKTRKGAKGVFYSLRSRDPDFASEWDSAIEEANDRLIISARQRAIEGVSRLRTHKDSLIYVQDPETGENVPITDRVYSDRLMEILLKGGFPDKFVERRLTEHVHHAAPSGWTITKEDLLALTDQEGEQLMAILGKVRNSRRELTHEPGEIIEVEAVEVIEHKPAPLHPWEEAE